MVTATKRAMVRKRARALICRHRRTVSLLVTCPPSSSDSRPPSMPPWAPPRVPPRVIPLASLSPPPPSVRTISIDGCSTIFIVFDVVGEAADEAEEEASTVLPRRVVVVDANRPPPPPPWADAAAGSRGGGGGGGGRDAKGMTQCDCMRLHAIACDCMRSHAIACNRMKSQTLCRQLSEFLKMHQEREVGQKDCQSVSSRQL